MQWLENGKYKVFMEVLGWITFIIRATMEVARMVRKKRLSDIQAEEDKRNATS